MTGRVILFGATGYTGRLAAEAMTRAGLAPVLAGRSPDALVALTGDLAGLAPIDAAPTWQAADVSDPASVRALVTSPQDVLVSTVGPFSRFGQPALDAAVDQGCGYIDSTGEPNFIRHVFEVEGPRAQRSGARLLTAVGFDYVPGNLAAALAIQQVRDRDLTPTVVEVGYFVKGSGMSSGTRASVAALTGVQPLARRGGAVVAETGKVATFDVQGKSLDAMPVGGSEVFTLQHLDPDVRDIAVFAGWAGQWTRAAHAASAATSVGARVPGIGALVRAGSQRIGGDATGEGPTQQERAKSSCVVVARVRDAVGRPLGSATIEGPSPYTLTGELLAWAAAMLTSGQVNGVGALGPIEAFGMQSLLHGCAYMGMHHVG